MKFEIRSDLFKKYVYYRNMFNMWLNDFIFKSYFQALSEDIVIYRI